MEVEEEDSGSGERAEKGRRRNRNGGREKEACQHDFYNVRPQGRKRSARGARLKERVQRDPIFSRKELAVFGVGKEGESNPVQNTVLSKGSTGE